MAAVSQNRALPGSLPVTQVFSHKPKQVRKLEEGVFFILFLKLLAISLSREQSRESSLGQRNG